MPKQPTTAQNLQRIAHAQNTMRYGGLMRLEKVDDKMTAGRAVEVLAENMECINATLVHIAEDAEKNRVELNRMRHMLEGGAALFAELQKRAAA